MLSQRSPEPTSLVTIAQQFAVAVTRYVLGLTHEIVYPGAELFWRQRDIPHERPSHFIGKHFDGQIGNARQAVNQLPQRRVRQRLDDIYSYLAQVSQHTHDVAHVYLPPFF